MVLAGGLGWKYKPILEYINKSSVREKIVLTGYVTDEEKEFLYRNATAFVFPSFYEGLGLPIIVLSASLMIPSPLRSTKFTSPALNS